MKNWQKLRILIVLFQICGNKSLYDGKDDNKKKKFEEEEPEKRGCRDIIADKIIDPVNKYKVMWDLSIGIVYLFSYILDPIVFAFKFEPLENESLRNLSQLVTYIIIVDILIVPFTGVYKDETEMMEDREKRKNNAKK